MKTGDFKEKRQFKRLQMAFPTKIKLIAENGEEKVFEGLTLDVSFNGAYVVNIHMENVNPEDSVNMSLAIPRDSTRDFPFSRIIGKARVVRVEKDAVALEFKEDVSRLFVAN
ncbi:MAG: PilZ domain-containing protein [Candidatus Omnitrophota bacterium]